MFYVDHLMTHYIQQLDIFTVQISRHSHACAICIVTTCYSLSRWLVFTGGIDMETQGIAAVRDIECDNIGLKSAAGNCEVYGVKVRGECGFQVLAVLC